MISFMEDVIFFFTLFLTLSLWGKNLNPALPPFSLLHSIYKPPIKKEEKEGKKVTEIITFSFFHIGMSFEI